MAAEERAIGTLQASSPGPGRLTGIVTYDNPCGLRPVRGEYSVLADTILVSILWPAAEAPRMCPLEITPDAYRFHLQGLPRRWWIVIARSDALFAPRLHSVVRIRS